MDIKQFSDGFDTMLNSYSISANFGKEASSQAITLDEYEKSVFLTKAQEEVVLSLYNGKNPYNESFESTEEIRRYLANLVAESSLKPITNTSGMPIGVASSSTFFTLPEDLWFITLEQVVVDKGKCGNTKIKVYPVKQDEYLSIKDNPFRGANGRRALRFDLSEGVVEIASIYTVVSYYVRYLKKPTPIILVDLPDELAINKVNTATECILHSALHQKILEMAVRLALQSKGYNINKE